MIEERLQIQDDKTYAQDKIYKVYKDLRDKKLASEIELTEREMDRLQLEDQILNTKQLQKWGAHGLESIEVENSEKYLSLLKKKKKVLEDEFDRLRVHQEALMIRAPYDGIIVESYLKFSGEPVEKGEPLLRIYSIQQGFHVKAWLSERNIDLVKKGQFVRMESNVYKTEGNSYMEGEVEKVLWDPDTLNEYDREQRYEVWISIMKSPFPPVNASRVNVEVVLGTGNLISSITGRPFNPRDI